MEYSPAPPSFAIIPRCPHFPVVWLVMGRCRRSVGNETELSSTPWRRCPDSSNGSTSTPTQVTTSSSSTRKSSTACHTARSFRDSSQRTFSSGSRTVGPSASDFEWRCELRVTRPGWGGHPLKRNNHSGSLPVSVFMKFITRDLWSLYNIYLSLWCFSVSLKGLQPLKGLTL